MMRCPLCTHSSYTRTSRYVTEQTKEAYYQCQNIVCSCTFKSKRKPSAVCSHQASAGNLDVHLYRRTSKYGIPILAKKKP